MSWLNDTDRQLSRYCRSTKHASENDQRSCRLIESPIPSDVQALDRQDDYSPH